MSPKDPTKVKQNIKFNCINEYPPTAKFNTWPPDEAHTLN